MTDENPMPFTPDWCAAEYHRVNPGALGHPSVPSLYLYDFAKAVRAASEREAVRRERAAAWRMARYYRERGYFNDVGPSDNPMAEADHRIAEWFPLPKVERPRVVHIQGMGDYKIVDGRMWFRIRPVNEWTVLYPKADLAALADLLASPTEAVDDEEDR